MATNEDLESEVKALADTLGTVARDVGRKVDNHTSMLTDVRLRLATMDTRLGAVDTRLYTVDERLNSMDEKLDRALEVLTRIEGKMQP